MHLSRLSPTTANGPRVLTSVLLLLATLSAVAAGALPGAAAAGTLPWTVTTAANSFGADRQSYRYTIDPGGRLEDGLVVVNNGTTRLHLALRAADAFTTDAGQLGLVADDAKSTGVGAWVRPDRDDVTVRPGESIEVPFAVAVPEGAAPGDYMGGIVASLGRVGEASADRRADIPIRLRVGGALQPSLAVEGVHVRYSGTPNPFGKGDATVSYAIHNTGNAILTARQTVSVAGPFGRWAVRAGTIADSPPLLPDDSWKVSVPLDGVPPALRLTATVTLVPLLNDAAGSTAPLAATTTAEHTWAVPWALLVPVVLLCGLVGAGVVFRRRRPGGAS